MKFVAFMPPSLSLCLCEREAVAAQRGRLHGNGSAEVKGQHPFSISVRGLFMCPNKDTQMINSADWWETFRPFQFEPSRFG